jgi:hypothetical protein
VLQWARANGCPEYYDEDIEDGEDADDDWPYWEHDDEVEG